MRERTGMWGRIANGVLVTFLASGGVLRPAAAAQEPSTGGVAMGIAVDRLGLVDAVASALPYDGWTPGVTLSYRRRGPSSRWSIGAAYGRGGLTSAIAGAGAAGAGRERSHVGSLTFEHLRTFPRSDAFRLLLGGRIGGRLLYRTHDYPPFGTQEYIDFVAPLEASLGWSRSIGAGGDLSQRVAVPLASVVFRDPWSGAQYRPDGRVAAPWDVFAFDHRLVYRTGLAGQARFEIAHRLSYLRYADEPYLTVVTHGVDLTLEWSW